MGYDNLIEIIFPSSNNLSRSPIIQALTSDELTYFDIGKIRHDLAAVS